MLNNLFIDVSLDSCNFLLFSDDKKQVIVFNRPTNNNLVELVVDLLANFLQQNQVTYDQLCKIYLNLGPGSFTGIKVGVNLVKTLKLVYPSLKIYTTTTDKLLHFGNGVAVIDAKSHKYFVSIFKNNESVLRLQIIDAEQLKQIEKKYQESHFFYGDKINWNDKMVNIVNNLNIFEICEDFLSLTPIYIKNPI